MLSVMKHPSSPRPVEGNPDAPPDHLAGRVTIRLDEVASLLGISRRVLERERSAGRFPRPDMTIGRMPLWKPDTIRAWVEGGGR
jgi:predicted DNA-binding transcriptional regulator AlpA